MLKKKKLTVNLIFLGASALFTVLVIGLIIVAKGGCGGSKGSKKNSGVKIEQKTVRAVGLRTAKKTKAPEPEEEVQNPDAEADAAAAAKRKEANARALREAVEENKEILDKPITDKTTIAELDEMIRVMEPLVRKYGEDQSDTDVYQRLKKKYDLAKGQKAMME